MGADKAFVTLDGQTLLARALEVARAVTADVRIVGDGAKFAAFAPVVEDVFRGCGPLGGIHAALRASAAGFEPHSAVDVPFVSSALLEFLIERARGCSAIVTVARSGRRFQPLVVYRREFAEAAERALGEGRYKIDALFDVVTTLVVEEEELAAAGFSAGVFRNLNTREDVEAAGKESRGGNSFLGRW